MEKLKRAYYYLFYKFYKMSEAAPARWMSDWKAGLVIIALEIFTIASIFIYYKILFNRAIDLEEHNWSIYLCVLLVVIPNYFAFVHTDVWKDYVKKFDALPKKKNRIGSWIVFGIVVLVIANLVFAFYLMSRIDWSQYR